MIYIKPSTAKRVVFKAFLDSDHVSEATGKTIAITISKNGGAFGNPSAGATNATEISGGWYYVDLSTTDTNTSGPLAGRGTNADIDDVGFLFEVGQSPADVTHWLGTAAATPTTAGVPEVDITHIAGSAVSTSSAQIGVNVVNAGGTAWGSGAITAGAIAANAITAAKLDPDVTTELQSGLATAANLATLQSTADAILLDTAEIGAAGAGLTNINLPDQTMNITGNITGNLSGSVGSVTGAVGSVTGLTASDVAAIKNKTDSLAFTVAGQVDANIQYVNDVQVTGTGTTGDEWGP